MRRRRFKIQTQFALALLFFLAVGIWALRIPLCESFLQARLSALGIADANFEVASVSPWRIDIQNLHSTGGVRLTRGELAIEWSTPLSPRLTTITLTGLELETDGSSNEPVSRNLIRIVQANTVNDGNHGSETNNGIPEILIRNASARIISADDSVIAEVSTPSVSLSPSLDSDSGDVDDSTRQTFDLKAALNVRSLQAQGLNLKNGFLSITGRIERREGQLNYRPEDCDTVSLNGLKKEHISLSGPVNACVSAGDGGSVVAIDRDGRITLNVLVKPEPAMIDVSVSALPSFPAKFENGSFLIKFPHGPNAPQDENIVVQGLNLVFPTAGISLDGVEVLAMTHKDNADPPDLLFDFTIPELRHLATPAILQPLAIEGKAEWSSESLAIDGTFQQSARALNGKFHLHRDNETGEGEANFNISPLDFDNGGLVVSDVSPVIGRYLASLAGQVNASGKILFNDAWATPIQIAGNARNLVVTMNKTPSSPADEVLAVDFGESELNGSLPPLSPEKGRASVNIVGGGLRLGDAALKDLTGTINFLSFSPLACPKEPNAGSSEINGEEESATRITNCLYESFAKDEPESSKAVFSDVMDQLTGYLTQVRVNQSPNQ